MFSIILQAGGKSTRMGTDKALLDFLGTPLIIRLRDRFLPHASELITITNSFDGYEKLDLPLFQDIIPDRGALGGLYTALAVSSQPLVGLIAADMPFASPDLIVKEMEILLESDFDAIIPSSRGGIEPLHAVYRRESCLPLVKAAIDKDLWRMVSWHEHARIKILDAEESMRISGAEYTFMNLNTPEDFQSAEMIAQEIPGYS